MNPLLRVPFLQFMDASTRGQCGLPSVLGTPGVPSDTHLLYLTDTGLLHTAVMSIHALNIRKFLR